MSDLISMDMVLLILAAAVATYLTRIGGYVLITRMKTIPPRMEQALNAVPAAVLTTLVAPAFFNGGWDVKIAMLAALVVGIRYPGLLLLGAGWAAAMICRHLLGF
ncbi:AzlD family protein [Neorhizobium galegae]|uniref:Branched-chain amino acid transport n=2 Tax=Neorhizobium galegae TaxID=399 RepID=A0A068SPV2_NEOGA|nr:AzlD family protein [Neorhizobium galegae]KAB1087049.1 AzlD family protein [Neorhizobium galegae]MCQ1852393.1 AzlD family protein [Neorhizobium galegae]CDN48327.1 Branched-chain amino acid transport [Neorhizobium galegae bv. orientalis str. HAMBI 540]CDZ46171.1 Putative membrane protein [Neorhizobium galegae bv. orientalis]